MKPDLTDVTICAVDSVNVGPAARALNHSVAQCRFADAILFSHENVSGSFRTVRTERIKSTREYSEFVFKQLPKIVETPFVLIVQWDGYVIDPSAWRASFRDYDYIGARWPHVSDGMSVGNGGFSLRSRKFMAAMMDARFPMRDGENSDWLVCHTYRPQLERDFGIRFATEQVADGFSYETVAVSDFTKDRPPTFGFHGMGNMWRYVDDAEMISFVDSLAPYALHTEHCAKLVAAYLLLGRFELFGALYARMDANAQADALRAIVQIPLGESKTAARCAILAYRLMRHSRLIRSLVVGLMQLQRRAFSIAKRRGRDSAFES